VRRSGVDDVLIDDEEPHERPEPIKGEVALDIYADRIDFEVRDA
jgi:hypothetical protein